MSSFEFKTIKNIKYLTFLAIFNIVLILLLSLNAFYQSDDYGYMIDLKQNGIIDNCINGYYNWDGRFLSLGAFVQGFCLLYLPVELIVFIWSLCFLLSGYFAFLILELELKLKFESQITKCFIALMLVLIFWFGAHTHFCETIYWATGGAYSFALLLGAMFTYFFLKLQIFKSNLIIKTCFLIFAFLVGGSTQNLSLPILTLIFIHFILDFLNAKKDNLIFNFLLFISALAGLIFISTAPGNMFRVKAVNHDYMSQLNVFILIKNYCYVTAKFFLRSIVSIFLASSLTVSINMLSKRNFNFSLKDFIFLPKTKSKFSIFLQTYKWFFVAISSAIPFIIIPDFSGKRTVIYFQFFIIIFICSFVFKFFTVNQSSNKKFGFNFQYLFFCLLSMGTFFLFFNNYKSSQLKLKITERENMLKSSRGKTVHLKLIDSKLSSPSYNFEDFSDDSDFIKVSQESFFGVKIIVDK